MRFIVALPLVVLTSLLLVATVSPAQAQNRTVPRPLPADDVLLPQTADSCAHVHPDDAAPPASFLAVWRPVARGVAIPCDLGAAVTARELRPPSSRAAVNAATLPGPGLVTVMVLLLVSALSAIRWAAG